VRELTEAAKAAQAIRSELKKAFPEIKFRIRSSNYAGGDSVRIVWSNGPTSDSVEEITAKYQYGHFDGMVDMYEYSNSREDIPQARFVFASREITTEAYAAKKAAIAKKFGIEDPADDTQWYKVFSRWPQEVIYRELQDQVLEGAPA
jgi:hypothetical protein